MTSLFAITDSLTMLAAGDSSGGGFFGFAWPKFFAQVIIFFVVYKILSKFAFGPIVEMLETRRRRIAEAESWRDQVKEEMNEAGKKAGEVIAKADETAARLVGEAKDAADSLAERKRQEAIQESTQIIAKAREASEMEREKILGQLQSDFGRLVADATTKVTGKILDKPDHDRINKETSAQIGL